MFSSIQSWATSLGRADGGGIGHPIGLKQGYLCGVRAAPESRAGYLSEWHCERGANSLSRENQGTRMVLLELEAYEEERATQGSGSA